MADNTNYPVLTDANYFVGEKWVRLNEILTDYDPYLELHWIPPDKRATEDKNPYVIIHNIPGKQPYRVMFAKETDDPVHVFAKILASDGKHHHVLNELEKINQAQEIFDTKKRLEDMEEAKSQVNFLITGKNYVTMRDEKSGELIKYDSLRRRIKTKRTIV